jgi:hypothetical protein
VITVAHGGVPAARPVLVSVVRVVWCRAGGHVVSSSPCPDSQALRCGSRPRGRSRCSPTEPRARRRACRKHAWPRARLTSRAV